MKVLIVTHAVPGSTYGNRITARRWADLIRKCGHTAHVAETSQTDMLLTDYDCLLALHARRSAGIIGQWREHCGNRPLAVCLTGTDLHLDLADPDSPGAQVARRSLQLADRIVLLEPVGSRHLSPEWQQKSVVIFQSAQPVPQKPTLASEHFVVTVPGHLRDVKDPFRTEAASRLLPQRSRILVRQLGSARQPEMADQARQREAENVRYQWLGELPHAAAMQCLAGSHLMVLASRAEGAPSSISEAVVNDVPVLATRIDASRGMLGEDYPGFFEVGQTQELANLLWRAESDENYYASLLQAVRRVAGRFQPARERQALGDLVTSLMAASPGER